MSNLGPDIETISADELAASTLLTFEAILVAAEDAIKRHGAVGFSYLRISDDPEGREFGIRAQNEDTKGLGERQGVPVLKAFTDNDISASTLSRKPRPDYDLMVRLVKALPKGTVRLYAYSNSRLTRRPRELEDWIEMHKATGVLIKTVVSGDDDLSTADGRFVARVKANADAAEAERTSERVTRRIDQFRKEGISGPGGARAFGYLRGGTEIIEAEAEAIRKGSDILLKGGTVGDVIRAWGEDGVKPVKATHWSRRTVQGIYRSPRIAGLHEWEGELIESKNVPTILPRATWEATKECLAPKDLERGPDWWTMKNLLSGLLICGKCGHRMGARGPHYGCLGQRGGCNGVFRNREWVDKLVSTAMDIRLETLPTHVAPVTGDLQEVQQEIAQLEASIDETLAMIKAREVAPQDGFPLVRDWRHDLNVLRTVQASHVQDAASKLTPQTALTLWNSPELAKKRQALAAEIQMIVIHPLGRRAGYGRHVPLPPESVDIVWTS